MSETEYTENGELYPIMIEGLTEKEAAEYKQILGRFLESYKKSDGEQQEFQWLKEQLREELPEKTDQEIEEIKEKVGEIWQSLASIQSSLLCSKQ